MQESETKQTCYSSHGLAGYAMGSYWDGDAIICGCCGARIENPPPVGSRRVHAGREPVWPAWIGGKRGKSFQQ